MTLVPETGSGIPGANSYVSLTEAGDLLAEIQISSAWTNISEPVREALLVRASGLIDREFSFRGEILTRTQGLSFPRKNLTDRNDREILGNPRFVREATAELAYSLSKTSIVEDNTVVDEIKVGPIDIKLGNASSVKKLMPDSVIQKLSFFGSYSLSRRRSRKLAY